MAALTTQPAVHAGMSPTFTAADAAGDTFAPGDDVVLHVKNGSAAAVTVTIASPTPCSQGSTHPLAVSVPAAGERIIGPFPAGRFAQPSSGRVNVTYSAAASVTVAVYRA